MMHTATTFERVQHLVDHGLHLDYKPDEDKLWLTVWAFDGEYRFTGELRDQLEDLRPLLHDYMRSMAATMDVPPGKVLSYGHPDSDCGRN